jgi:magnesium chelatase subunit I
MERRAFLQKSSESKIRITDLQALVPAITGKIELVYEGEQEGVSNVAKILIGKSIKTVFNKYFPVPDKRKKQSSPINEYDEIVDWFSGQKMISISSNSSDEEYIKSLEAIPSLDKIVKNYLSEYIDTKFDLAVAKEFVLEALHQFAFLSKYESNGEYTYKDLVETIFNSMSDEGENDLDYYSQ